MTSRGATRAWTQVRLAFCVAAAVVAAPLSVRADEAGRLRPLRQRPARVPAPRESAEQSRLSALCVGAALAAEKRYGLPSGLLLAIGQVETGRPNPATGRVEPWPWSVQANGRSLYFSTKADAMASVREIRAKGTVSVDTGCLQVNLAFHPDAFTTLDDAFDPVRNADYAARFLVSLHAATRDWWQATGLYHSKTVPLATVYRGRVERAFVASVASARLSILQQLQNAWRATLPADEQNAAPSYTRIGSTLQPAAWGLGAVAPFHGVTAPGM